MLLLFSSDQLVLMEREARDGSRELVRSRKDVTPSDSPFEELAIGEVEGIDKGVNRNRVLEAPCTKSGLVGMRTGGLVTSGFRAAFDEPDDLLDGLPLEDAVT